MTRLYKKKIGESKNIPKNKSKLKDSNITKIKIDIIKPIATPKSTDGTNFFAYITKKFLVTKTKGGKTK